MYLVQEEEVVVRQVQTVMVMVIHLQLPQHKELMGDKVIMEVFILVEAEEELE